MDSSIFLFLKNNFLKIYRASIFFSDQLAFFTAFNLSFFLREITKIHPDWNIIAYQEYLPLYAVSVVIMIILFYQKGLYTVRQSVFSGFNLYELVAVIVRGCVILALFTLFYWKIHSYSRLILVIYSINLLIWNSMFRMIIFYFFRKIRVKKDIIDSAILITLNKSNLTLEKKLTKNPYHGFRLKKVLYSDSEKNIKDELSRVDLNEISAILVCGEVNSQLWNFLSGYCVEKNLELILFPPVYDILITEENSGFIAGEFAVFQSRGRIEKGYLFIKRLLDVIFSTFTLIILMPLFILIAVLIKLDSKGPVFFIQDRTGRNGNVFSVLKFRTMYCEALGSQNSPDSSDDNRITKIGKYLRKLSFDEFPQFINVLKGDMSIVGPRPEMPFKTKTYNNNDRIRLLVKPGITGLWQVMGRKDRLELHEDLKYDFYYIQNRSIVLDIKIMIQTIPVILLGEGV